MAFPTDIKLPNNARYFTFASSNKAFNSNYDITWSSIVEATATVIVSSKAKVSYPGFP